MLNINYSEPHEGIAPPPHQVDVINTNHMLMVSCSADEVRPVALRCEAPLDAFELDLHGYRYGYFERNNLVTETTFLTLNQLGLNTVAYFCDVNGAHFDIQKMVELAAKYHIKLCRVLLPFSPTNFACWDESQWRIFDSRLTLALHCKVRHQRVPFFTDKEHSYAYLQ